MTEECFSESLRQTPSTFPNETFQKLLKKGCNCTSISNAISAATNDSYLMCEAFPFAHKWWSQVVYIIVFSVLILVSIGGNCTVIWVVLAHKRMRSVTNYFLLNLAIADCSISVLNVCFAFTLNFYVRWFFGKAYCSFYNFMGVTPTCASVFTLIGMSLDRYMAIVHPLRPRLSHKKTISCIVAIWVLAVICGLPNFLASQLITNYFYFNGEVLTQYYCLATMYPDGIGEASLLYRAYQQVLLVIMYIFPLIVLSVTFIRVGTVLWGSSNIGEHRQDQSINTKRKVVKMMMVVVCLFMICWLPYHIYFTVLSDKLNATVGYIWSMWIYIHIYLLAMSSTVVNPIIYCWMNESILVTIWASKSRGRLQNLEAQMVTRMLLILVPVFRIAFKFVFRFLPFISMNKEQYYGSDLFRDNRYLHVGHSTSTHYCTNTNNRANALRHSRTSSHQNVGISSRYGSGASQTSQQTVPPLRALSSPRQARRDVVVDPDAVKDQPEMLRASTVSARSVCLPTKDRSGSSNLTDKTNFSPNGEICSPPKSRSGPSNLTDITKSPPSSGLVSRTKSRSESFPVSIVAKSPPNGALCKDVIAPESIFSTNPYPAPHNAPSSSENMYSVPESSPLNAQSAASGFQSDPVLHSVQISPLHSVSFRSRLGSCDPKSDPSELIETSFSAVKSDLKKRVATDAADSDSSDPQSPLADIKPIRHEIASKAAGTMHASVTLDELISDCRKQSLCSRLMKGVNSSNGSTPVVISKKRNCSVDQRVALTSGKAGNGGKASETRSMLEPIELDSTHL